ARDPDNPPFAASENLMVKCTPSREKRSRQALVDDHRFRRPRYIALIESASLQHGNLQGAEIARANHAHEGVDKPSGDVVLAGNSRSPATVAIERNSVGDTGGFDARYGANRIGDAVEKCDQLPLVSQHRIDP